MNQVGDWSWRTVTVDHVGELIRQHFTAGDHIIEISGRSRGHVLDRFTLYKYDDVNFNDGVFTNAPQSPHMGDEIEVIAIAPTPTPEPEPEPQPVPQPVPESESESEQNTNLDTGTEVIDNQVAVEQTLATEANQPWQIPANLLGANECSDGVISLTPTSDIYIESGEIKNNGDLVVDGSGRSALLQFDLSNVPSTVTSAALTFTAGADAGEGTLMLSTASHSSWNETDASLLPDISHLIRNYNGVWSAETRYGLPFDRNLIDSESATLVVEMAQGSDGMSIQSLESDNGPRLNLAGPGTFCADFASNVVGTEATETDSLVKAEVTADTEGGGSIQLLELLFLSLSFVAINRQSRRQH